MDLKFRPDTHVLGRAHILKLTQPGGVDRRIAPVRGHLRWRKEVFDVEGLSVLDMIQSGWVSTYPLILFSMVTLTIIGERAWSLRGLEATTLALAAELCGPLEKGDFGKALQASQEKGASPAGRIFSDVLARHQSDSMEYLASLTEDKRFEELEALKGPLWVLATVSSSAPFIGLFGTVVGIIKAFHNMAMMGSGGFSVVAAGISEALIATALGLGVAIIAVIFYNYFQTRIERIDAALTISSNRVLDSIHLGRQGHGNRRSA